jgi:sigma-B regulation protein RsbU (phosphoserine phosphatase)
MSMMAQTFRMLDMARNLDQRDQSAVLPGLPTETGARPPGTSAQESPAENILAVKQDLIALRREHGKLQQSIYEAAQVQRTLCAPRELVWKDFEIAGEIFPVRHLSGDFFKVMELGSALGLAVGDIAGKGLTAGIWQAHLLGLIQRSARAHTDPADVIAEVNRELCQDHSEPPITSLFFGRLEPDNVLAFCNAGLPAPFLMRGEFAARERIEQSWPKAENSTDRTYLEEGGPMLGAVSEAKFTSGRVRLDPGDMLIAYSDGATECRNAQDEEFETHRLAAAAQAVRGKSANQALFSTLGTVLDFAGACLPSDDLTLLVVRRRDSIGPAQPSSNGKDSNGKSSSRPSPRATSAETPKKGNRRGNGSK